MGVQQARLRPAYASRRRAAELALVGSLLLAAGLAGLCWTWLQVSPPAGEPPRALAAVVSATPTPFQPVAPTPTASKPATLAFLERAPTAAPEPPSPAPGAAFAALFERPVAVTIQIEPPPVVNAGRAIQMSFTPGSDCAYGSGQACLSSHLGGRVTLLTVHSGLGGEGEPFRRAVEGTGLNMAFFSLARIQGSLAALSAAPVRLAVDGQQRDDLELAAAVRVPPRRLDAYFNQPFDEALEAAAQEDPALRDLLSAGDDLLIFEICGWQLPGEAWAVGVSPTTGSVYLGIIRKIRVPGG